MPSFHYKAVGPGGAVEEGRMDGMDEAAIIQKLRDGGYIPIRASRAGTGFRLSYIGQSKWKLSPQRLTAITHDLAALLRAGLTLDKALQLIRDLSENEAERGLVLGLEDALRNGNTFSAALQERPGMFPGFYAAMVRAGEAGGNLEPTLARLYSYLERSQALRSDIRSALIYPALLLTVSLASVAVLLVFVVPQFAQLLSDSGQPVPPATQAVLFASELLRGYWWTVPVLLSLAIVFLRRRLATPAGRSAADRLVLRLPVVGDVVRRQEVARFARALGTLQQNGVPLLSGVRTAGEVFTNRALAATVSDLAENLKQGRGLSGPMQASGQFPNQVVQLVKVGEESGQLEAMLLRIADLLDADIGRRIQRLMTMLEPILIVGMGVVIAGILFSILSTIMGLNDITF
ncbi:MAG: type II secretion system F family protein [Haliea sp.]